MAPKIKKKLFYSKQLARDKMKDTILQKYGMLVLRIKTNKTTHN